jgi:hypothetical protein
MANEINLACSLRVANGSFQFAFTPASLQVAQSNPGRGGLSQTIPTSDTLIQGLTDLTCNGFAVLRNLDPTNFVLWGPDNGSGAIVVLGKLLPGEYAVARIAPTVVLRAKADTAAVKLDVTVLEN